MPDSVSVKIKQHIMDYKDLYLIAGTLVVGLAVGKIIFGRDSGISIPITNSPIFNVPVNINTSFGGHAHKLVKCLETNQIWETVADAARSAGTNPSAMSKHLNGHRDHLYGLHYVIIGLGAGA